MMFFAPVRLALGLSLALLLAPAAPAQDRSGPVMDMLSHLPLAVVEPEQPFEVEYGSPQAAVPALLLGSGDLERARIFGTGRGMPQRVAQFLFIQLDGAKALVGFEMTDIRESASVMQAERTMTLFRFEPGIEDAVGPALEALDYVRDDQGGVPVWARGGDYETNLAGRDPANPFGGALGRFGRVAVDGDLVAWSPAWPAIRAFAAGAPGMETHPHIAALIAALDAPGAGPGVLIAARFTLDPGQRYGSPAVMSVDMANGTQDVALFAFVVPPDQDAEVVAARAEWNWRNTPMRSFSGPETFADRFGGEAEFSVIATDDPVVLIRLTKPRDGIMSNRSYLAASALILRGDLEVLLAPRAP